MLHEIHPHRFSNIYYPDSQIKANDFILHYRENKVLLKKNGAKYELPAKKDFPEIDAHTYNYLFSLDNVYCFLYVEELKQLNTDLVFEDISFFRTTSQHEIAWVCLAGLHLKNWYAENKYCGKCGSATRHKLTERALFCPECDRIIYPRISPAVIVAITCGNKILLARNTAFKGGWYSLLAGYVDIGESLEETLVREVKEEVGIDIKNIRYYKSQPWPLSGSIMIGFVAEADESHPIKIDEIEIAEAAWFTRGNLPPHSSTISIAGEMIERFEMGEL